MFLKLLLFICLCITLPISGAEGFTAPEEIQYDLILADFKVGSMSLSAQKRGQAIRFTSTLNTEKIVSYFYKVDDHAISVLIPVSSQKKSPKDFPFAPSSYIERLSEGPHRYHKEFIFDSQKKKITYTDHLKPEKSSLDLKGNVFDPLSALYYIRQMPLPVGKSVFVDIFNNKQIYNVEVQVLRKEQVTTPLGSFNTIVVRSNMNGVGDGAFYYVGDIYIWLTDDEKRMPVIIEKRLDAIVKDGLPDFVSKNMPDFIRKNLSAGAIRAVSVKAF